MVDSSSPSRRARWTRAAWRRVPKDRRIQGLGGLRGRWLLLIRTLVRPLLAIDVTLRDSRGVTFVVTRDPVDALVVNDLTGSNRAMYFPRDPAAEDVSLVLDVGGHHGHYAVAAAERYPRSQIISVEPAARGVELIDVHAKKNRVADRVEIVRAAIASEAGTGELHHDPTGSWGSSLFEVGGETEAVQLVSLEDVLRGRQPDVIKCNAEGGEFDLVTQVLALGLRPALMVLMVHPEFGDDQALLRSLVDAGFSLESVGTDHRPAYLVRPSD